jgi:DNA-binding transcriptional LysR family regulator
LARYTLRQLEYFIAVGETESIARASEKINVSSPSISAAISQLEQEFQVPLFVRRHAQGVSLTPGGRQLLEQARQVLRATDQLADIAAEISGSVRGPLSVGCLVTFAQLVLPMMRRGFEDAHPDVRIHQCEMNQAELFSALRRSDIDVAMTYDMDIPTDLQFTGLTNLKPYAVFDAQHPLAAKGAIEVADLSDLPMVLLDLPISSDYFLSLFHSTGRQPHIAERTRDLAVMRSLVGNGFGYSIANVLSPVDLSPDGKPLRYVPLAGKTRALRMGLLTAHDADRSSVVRAFIQFAKDRAAAGQFAAIGGEPAG